MLICTDWKQDSSIDIGLPVIRISYSPTSGFSAIVIRVVGALYALLCLACFKYRVLHLSYLFERLLLAYLLNVNWRF